MRILILFAVINITLSCNTSTKEENRKEIKEMNRYTYTHKKEIMYGISIQIDMPFELYFDDIAIAKEYSKARKVMGIDINPYLLSNGKYSLKIKLFPIQEKEGFAVYPKDVETSFVKVVRYELQRQPNMGRAKNYMVLKELPLPKIEQPVTYLEQEWEVEITDLPYKLEGWSNSKDLSKMNQKELEKKVVDYYRYLRDLLNDGKGKKYFNLQKQKQQETTTFGYYSQQEMEKTKSEQIENLNKEATGNMLPIERYKMFVYGHGKLVKLERIDEYFKPWSVLIRETEEDYISTGAMLHMRKGSDTFKVIRK